MRPILVVEFFDLPERMFQLAAARRLTADERLTLALQPRDLLFEARLFQQVGVARQHGHIFREVHAAAFVHTALVDGTHSQIIVFEAGG